jgi:hypothetical protein
MWFKKIDPKDHLVADTKGYKTFSGHPVEIFGTHCSVTVREGVDILIDHKDLPVVTRLTLSATINQSGYTAILVKTPRKAPEVLSKYLFPKKVKKLGSNYTVLFENGDHKDFRRGNVTAMHKREKLSIVREERSQRAAALKQEGAAMLKVRGHGKKDFFKVKVDRDLYEELRKVSWFVNNTPDLPICQMGDRKVSLPSYILGYAPSRKIRYKRVNGDRNDYRRENLEARFREGFTPEPLFEEKSTSVTVKVTLSKENAEFLEECFSNTAKEDLVPVVNSYVEKTEGTNFKYVR